MIKISFGPAISGVPFAWIIATGAVFVYMIGSDKKIHLDSKSLVFLMVILMVIFWAPYQLSINPKEYLIRFLQFFSAVVVYLYARNNFFLTLKTNKVLLYFLILQMPSILFGIFEVIFITTNSQFVGDILFSVREITSGRPDVVYMKTVVFHFFEHSMSVSYVLMLLTTLILIIKGKSIQLNFKEIFKWLKNQSILTWEKFMFYSVILFVTFHRSGTYLAIIVSTMLYSLIFLRLKNILLFIILPFIMFFLFRDAPYLLLKIEALLQGEVISSDFYRFSTILSSIGNLLQYPFGTGAGSFSANYFSGIEKFLSYIDPNSLLNSLVYENSDILAKQGYGATRATAQSLYFGILSELGVFFIFFLLIFHRGILFGKPLVYRILEFMVFVNLFLGYPMAYPQLWISLGLLHRAQEFERK